MMDPHRYAEPHRSRRSFLKHSGAAALALGSGVGLWTSQTGANSPGGTKVIDCHEHLQHRSGATWESGDRKLIAAADRLGIDQLCCSILTPRRPATAEGFRECNRWVLDATQRYPGRVLGYCYVNPGCGAEALVEIRRCVEEDDFIGIKLYNEFKCT